MDYLRSLGSAASAILSQGSGSIPGLPGYTLGERDTGFEGLTIWNLYEGVKKDDQTPVSIFSFEVNQQQSSNSHRSPSSSSRQFDRRSLIPLASNALRKLRTTRHPDVLKFIDGSENDNGVWIVTERVEPLTRILGNEGGGGSAESSKGGHGDEWKGWGLFRISTALKFLSGSASSTHGNVRISSIFMSPAGEWRLGGFELVTNQKEGGVLYTHSGLLPDSAKYSSPETRKTGWDALKELDPSALDSYQLHLLIYTLFNGPLPSTFTSPSGGEAPSLPNARGSIPPSIFQPWRRLGNPNPRARMKLEAFWDVGMASEGGFFKTNKLISLAEGLEGFALASEGERATLIKTIREADAKEKSTGSGGVPKEFLKYKVVPCLVQASEFGSGGSSLLPLILSISSTLPPTEYNTAVIQPIVRMFASADRAMRMALLENLPAYADKLEQKIVVEKIWPNLITGFTDVVPVIREATVKSVLLIAPKLNDRLLNNDLLRHLAKSQTDPEPGIRTNTCILLGRLSKHLQPATSRKVLVPAFARSLRDPFVHARIAGLMALMATVDCYEKEDLAGKVIPSMSICLIDKEKTVRDQAFRAMAMFIKKVEQMTASMPDTALPPPNQSPNQANEPVSQGQPGLATSAAGAAGALAGWAFTSISKKLTPGDLQTTPATERPSSTPPLTNGHTNGASSPQAKNTPLAAPASMVRANSTASLQTAFDAPKAKHVQTDSAASFETAPDGEAVEDWGGDLMDVNADADDWASFETAPVASPSALPSPNLEARLSTTTAPRTSTKPPAPIPSSKDRVSALKLGSKPARPLSQIVAPIEDAGDGWDLDDAGAGATDAWDEFPSTTTEPGARPPSNGRAKPTAGDDWGNFDEEEPERRASTGASAQGSSAAVSKAEKERKMAEMREERRARMAALKEQKKATLGAKKL